MDFKKTAFKVGKGFIIGILSVIFVTVGIDAVDNYDNMSESIVSRLLFGGSEGPCPENMIFIPDDSGGFCIDKFESSPGKNCPISDPRNQSETRENIDSALCRSESVKDALPWRFISQTQAQIACAKSEKRLPTSEEWYLASLGTPDKESDWQSDDCQVSENWESQPGKTGQAKLCHSSAGAFDMIGNVWEWVKGEIVNGSYKGTSLPGSGYIEAVDTKGTVFEIAEDGNPNFNEDYLWIKKSGIRGLARGGYWANGQEGGIYSMYLVSPPSFAGAGVGFRCVK